ncbi:MAG: class I SAM-dependent methyltransferase [Pseudomonadota bacterium]
MDSAEYGKLAEREQVHWWHVSRRQILSTIVRDLNLPTNAQILDVGAGTGGNLGMLSDFGALSAMEFDDTARRIATDATGISVRSGALPDDIPFPERSFDLVAAFDVIEHIEDDRRAVAALYATTKPGGCFVSTVPAYSWMWSEHDELLHHKRRYTMPPYARMIAETGFRIEKRTYFNTFLFPLAASVRLGQTMLGKTAEAERTVPGPAMNSALTRIFSSEASFLGSVSFPFGLSILVVARRPKGDPHD